MKDSSRRQFWRANGWCLLLLTLVTALPVLLTGELWLEVWSGVRAQAWDGAGHQALAQIYNETTFPDTFSWTHAFFCGMPHPNFYPPLFYWLIALLTHTHLVSFITAFKLILVLPTLAIPAATWMLGWKLSKNNPVVATCAALSIVLLLVDYRFFISSGPLGITYMSTFLTGLYSHPLGYLFLIAWYVVYAGADASLWRIVCAALLLALTLLSSFFGGSVAAVFILTTVVHSLVRWRRAATDDDRGQARRLLLANLISPLLAACLTLFWLVPVLASRDYIVTQPSAVPFSDLVPPAMRLWYALALPGLILGFWRRSTAAMRVYLTSCVILAAAIFSAGVIAPRWFPMHPARLIATLNFLLGLPVGLALAFVVEKAATMLAARAMRHSSREERGQARVEANGLRQPLSNTGAALALLSGVVLVYLLTTPASYSLAFYPTADTEAIDPLLRFAGQHREGRYLVEVPPFNDLSMAHESRAINNYLAAQGNEVLSLFFREASPSVIFLSPLVDRFSQQADPYGISSTLADDKDFANQPVSAHLRQARLIGVRYLVIRSPWSRSRLEGQPDIKGRYDFGRWSIYELRDEPMPRVIPLTYKPALVVSDLNVKGRRQNSYDFIRFAEEQFASGWYDVLLARSNEMKLDRLNLEDNFGALIIDTYEFDDENLAFERLREFARQRTLILLSSDAPLFRRIQASISDFAQAKIIERPMEPPGKWIEPGRPTLNYSATSIRRVWRELRDILNERKTIVAGGANPTSVEFGLRSINILPPSSPPENIPVLVQTTFHPNWQRADDAPVYAATPFFMLTFVRQPTRLVFARRAADWAGVIISAITLLLLCGYTLWHYRRRAGVLLGKARLARRRKYGSGDERARV